MFEPVQMKNSGDCWAVCLVMLLGESYDKVWHAAPRRGKPEHNGVTVRQLHNIARRLGHTTHYVSWLSGGTTDTFLDAIADDAGARIGILDLDHETEPGHYVMHSRGVLYNPAQHEIWTDVDAFLARGCNGKPWTVSGILYAGRWGDTNGQG